MAEQQKQLSVNERVADLNERLKQANQNLQQARAEGNTRKVSARQRVATKLAAEREALLTEENFSPDWQDPWYSLAYMDNGAGAMTLGALRRMVASLDVVDDNALVAVQEARDGIFLISVRTKFMPSDYVGPQRF